MARGRAPSKKPKLKACKKCGALVTGETNVCPVCGSTEFTTNWEGMIVIINPETSELAKELDINSPGIFAIRVAGRVVKRREA
ncbi:MAG: DNA-directed RNA polymerase, subunit E'' [Desulfurococcales archaeon]|nr:DNA-directed RNA polymerase, subunit E'' [Desulfurococcales archaeon]